MEIAGLMQTFVRISDISLYLRCPRLVYFDALGRMSRKVSLPNLLLHDLMLSISDCEDLEGRLMVELANLEQELPLVYGEEVNSSGIFSAAREVEALIPNIAQSLSRSQDMLLPCDVDIDLRSERLGLSARLDRLIKNGYVPSIIRTGMAPAEGIWKSDRLKLAGICMLIEEKYCTRIDRGLVEYPRSGIVREAQIHSIDRSRVLRLRDRIRQIKEGRLPERPKEARCDDCDLRDSCETRVSLASKFF
jgi:CRISPR-associated exonuclease Cas4